MDDVSYYSEDEESICVGLTFTCPAKLGESSTNSTDSGVECASELPPHPPLNHQWRSGQISSTESGIGSACDSETLPADHSIAGGGETKWRRGAHRSVLDMSNMADMDLEVKQNEADSGCEMKNSCKLEEIYPGISDIKQLKARKQQLGGVKGGKIASLNAISLDILNGRLDDPATKTALRPNPMVDEECTENNMKTPPAKLTRRKINGGIIYENLSNPVTKPLYVNYKSSRLCDMIQPTQTPDYLSPMSRIIPTPPANAPPSKQTIYNTPHRNVHKLSRSPYTSSSHSSLVHTSHLYEQIKSPARAPFPSSPLYCTVDTPAQPPHNNSSRSDRSHSFPEEIYIGKEENASYNEDRSSTIRRRLMRSATTSTEDEAVTTPTVAMFTTTRYHGNRVSRDTTSPVVERRGRSTSRNSCGSQRSSSAHSRSVSSRGVRRSTSWRSSSVQSRSTGGRDSRGRESSGERDRRGRESSGERDGRVGRETSVSGEMYNGSCLRGGEFADNRGETVFDTCNRYDRYSPARNGGGRYHSVDSSPPGLSPGSHSDTSSRLSCSRGAGVTRDDYRVTSRNADKSRFRYSKSKPASTSSYPQNTASPIRVKKQGVALSQATTEGVQALFRLEDTFVELRFSDSGLTPELIHLISELCEEKQIVRLIFEDCEMDDWDLLCDVIHRSYLLNVGFRNCNVGDEGCTRLADLLSDPSTTVTTLDLVNCRVGCAGVAALGVALMQNTVLTHLDLSGNPFLAKGAVLFFRALKGGNSTLQSLCLSNTCCGSVAVVMVICSLLLRDTDLAHLDLSHTQLTEDGLGLIVESLAHNTNLTSLSLSGNGLSDTAAHDLAVTLSDYQCSLLTVDLSHNKLSWSGVHVLVQASSVHKQVETIDLSHNDLTQLQHEDIVKIVEDLAMVGIVILSSS